MARPSNRSQRRAQITEALLVVMARRGYERATVAEIAREAGLASGLLHYHFKDKQAVLVELGRRLGAVLASRVQHRLAHETTPGGRLDAYLEAHLALGPDADPKAVASWVALGAEAIRQPEVREVYAKVITEDLTKLEGLVRAALLEKRGHAAGAKAIAAGIFAAIQGYFVLSAAAPTVVPAGTAAGSIKRMAAGLLASG